MIDRRWIAWCVVATTCIVACSRKKDEPAPETKSPAADTTTQVASTSPAAATDWVVVGHRIPGMSAMTDAEADKWNGRVIQLAPEVAISGPDTCASPVFTTTEGDADSLLGVEYRIRATDIGWLGDRVRMTRITCGGSVWAALGGTVIWLDDDRGLAPWDGVFFEIQSAAP